MSENQDSSKVSKGVGSQSEESETKLEEVGERMYDEDDDDDSVDEDDESSDPVEYYNLGWNFLRQGEFLKSFPNFENAFDLAKQNNRMDLFDRAINDFTKEITTGSVSEPSYYHCYRAMAFSSLQKYDLAISDMDSAIKLEKKPVIRGGFHFHRGLMRNKCNLLEGAVEDFTKAMELDPDGSCNAVVFRFLVNYKLGNKKRMKEDYDIIEEMENVPSQFMEDIRGIAARFNLSGESEKTKDVEPPHHQRIHRSNEEDDQKGQKGPLGQLGEGLPEDIFITEEVKNEVSRMSSEEKLTLLKTELANFETMTAEKDESRIMEYLTSGEMGRMSLLLDWFNSEARHWKPKFEHARKLVRDEKKYEEATPILTECLGFEPDHVESIYLRAVCYYHTDKIDPAFRDITRAIALDPQNHRFFSLLGYVMVSNVMFDQAIVAFNKAIEKNPDKQSNHEFYYILALLYDRTKDYSNSLTFIDQAIRMQPQNRDYIAFRQRVKDQHDAEIFMKERKEETERKKSSPKVQKTKQYDDDDEEDGEEEEDMDDESLDDILRLRDELTKKKRELESELEEKLKYLKEDEDREKERLAERKVEYMRQLAGSDDEEVDEEGELSDDDDDEQTQSKTYNRIPDDYDDVQFEDLDDEEEEEEVKEEKVKRFKKKKFVPRKEEEERRRDGHFVGTVLSGGDRIMFEALRALNLGEYFAAFKRKNIIWFDVVHGYLEEADYAEVFPRERFMRRFETYVEKYVVKTKKMV